MISYNQHRMDTANHAGCTLARVHFHTTKASHSVILTTTTMLHKNSEDQGTNQTKAKGIHNI